MCEQWSTPAGYDIIERTVAASKILEENNSTGCGVSLCAFASVVIPQRYMCKCLPLFRTSANLCVWHFVVQHLQVDRHQLYVAVYDLLYGRKKVKGREKVAVVVRKHAKVLRRCLSGLQLPDEGLGKSLGERTALTSNCALLVRYVRVNTLKASIEEVVDNLSHIGFTEVQPSAFWEVLETQKQGNSLDHPSHHHQWFTRDCHVPNLLVFTVRARLQETDLYERGHLVLQDKASCLPALLLSPSCGSHVIDACAAPGNKTTHLAAIMENCGSIEAFDIDSSRCGTLQSMVSKAGASCVQVHTEDFLKVDHQGLGRGGGDVDVGICKCLDVCVCGVCVCVVYLRYGHCHSVL